MNIGTSWGRVAAYLRVSTDMQGARHGTEAQEGVIRAWADRHGVRRIDWYQERPASGGSMRGREEMARLLADIGAGQFDTVVAYDLARIARSVSDACDIIGAVTRAGATLVLAKDGMEYGAGSGPMQRFMLHLMASLAELEREMTGERTSSGIRERLARGEKWGGARVVDPNRVGCRKFTDAQEAAIAQQRCDGVPVRALAERYGMSMSGMRNLLQRRGAPTL